jgi:hypothetical protein
MLFITRLILKIENRFREIENRLEKQLKNRKLNKKKKMEKERK